MSADFDKENIAEGLSAGPSLNNALALSPKKTGKKVRSKSIGPGTLGALDAPLKEDSGNRRKVYDRAYSMFCVLVLEKY